MTEDPETTQDTDAPPLEVPTEVSEVWEDGAPGTITGTLYEFHFTGALHKANGELVAFERQFFAPDADTALPYVYRAARRKAEIPQDATIEWANDLQADMVPSDTRWCVAGTVEDPAGHKYRLWLHVFIDGDALPLTFVQDAAESYLWEVFDIADTDDQIEWVSGPSIFESPESLPAPVIESDPVLSMRQGAIVRRMITRLEGQVTTELEAISRHENKIIEGRARIRELQREIEDARGIVPPGPFQGRLL